LVAFVLAAPAGAVQPDEQLADPALEARARDISAELRCLVCQNQSIDDSDAPLARDLRILVRQRLAAGDSDGDVRDYLVARYGDFVLLRPPLRAATLLLWLTPLLVVLAGAAVAFARFRRGDSRSPEVLSGAEEAQLARILHERQASVTPAGLPKFNPSDTHP
jgi:cytochrome c-type biogenesis protein CcmH